jgi:hypothetical protein
MRARQDLLHYARLHEDMEERLTLLSELTFRVERTEKSKAACIKASHELAELHCFAQNLDQGRRALATTYSWNQAFRAGIQPLRQNDEASSWRSKNKNCRH